MYYSNDMIDNAPYVKYTNTGEFIELDDSDLMWEEYYELNGRLDLNVKFKFIITENHKIKLLCWGILGEKILRSSVYKER